MAKEILALQANNTWVEVDLPPAIKGWSLHQLDVNNAFLQGDLDEEIYMKIPPGLARKGESKVFLLNKSIYGLKQASRQWFAKLSSFLLAEGFTKCLCDHSLFTYHRGSTSIFVLVYVDDIIISGTDDNFICSLKSRLASHFSIKDLGRLQYLLGIEVSRSPKGIFICQRKYVLDILKDSGLTRAHVSSFPMDAHIKLLPTYAKDLTDPSSFHRLIGRLLYLTVTRPDITYAINYLSQFMKHPRTTHLDAAHHVLRYLKGTIGHGIFLSSSSVLSLHGYTDSDWAGCPLTRRSTTCYFVSIGSSPISWKSKKQPTVARSSAEAEYRVMANLTTELQWLRYLFKDLHIPCPLPITISCDNQAAIHIAQNPVFHERTKHKEIDCYFVHGKLMNGLILPKYLPSADQLADVFTKPLGAQQFVRSGSPAPT
ncbi:uncharacterized protein LOC113351605 [Papaver somniferum]|uniref:uncharacterized protein LOC113351605 n=1 Tax=Papaver somniferum TaxID=3469 RepID=UPI000E702516|nr:uncharacterized protein LOC113351605 [Papaver somniferum]